VSLSLMPRALGAPMLVLTLGAVVGACGGAVQGGRDGSGAANDAVDVAARDGAANIDARDGGLDTSEVDGGAQGIWRALFDGGNIAGWDRYLGVPVDATAPLGLDDDPRGVFSVVTVEGAPAIRVSGEVWGALVSKDTFCDFHLRAQYKWGTRVWPPLGVRDSGLMYLSTGAFGAVNAGGAAIATPSGSGAFMISIEYQIAPSDVGAMANLGPITFTPLDRTVPTERAGDWNDIDVLVRGGVSTHTLNGVEVARGQGFVLALPGQAPAPLSCGKLQLQSEGAEIFFRALEIQSPP
jgi:hypothetical protein